MPKKIDLTGQRFGRLIVKREGNGKYTSGGNKKITWICDCDCGTKDVEVDSQSLRNGYTKSCGCWNLEKAKKSKFKNRIKYDLSGDYGVGYTQQGDEFWFDKEDYELVSNYNWHKHHNYFEAHVPMSNPRRTINLHRLVMGVADEKYDYTCDVDHIITENKFDNRKCNLRIATKQQNNCNKVIQKNNTSGIPGVHYSLYHNKWRAEIYMNKKRTQRDFRSKDEAVKWRKHMENIFYGNFSYDNSQNLLKEELV